VPAGLDLARATSTAAALCGVFNVLGGDVPHNAGSFGRVFVLLRENAVAGVPRPPACCSPATTDVADRIVNMTQAAFAAAADGIGLAEGGDGGGATPVCDGWVTWTLPVCAGPLYRDSVEIDELKYPVLFHELRLLTDSGGGGRFRGGPATRLRRGPRDTSVTFAFAADGWQTPPRGVRGGRDGMKASARLIGGDGARTPVPTVGQVVLGPGDEIEGIDCGGATRRRPHPEPSGRGSVTRSAEPRGGGRLT